MSDKFLLMEWLARGERKSWTEGKQEKQKTAVEYKDEQCGLTVVRELKTIDIPLLPTLSVGG